MFGMYLNDIERFICIHDNLWITLESSKLLSSKLSISICQIYNKEINNSNCLEWTILTPELPVSSQYPKLIFPEKFEFKLVGFPINVNILNLKKHQRYCLTTLKILQAAKITDAMLNSADRSFFQSLLEIDNLLSAPDDSGIPKGFLFNVYKILYLGTSEKDILTKIDSLFNLQDSEFPRTLQLYKSTFYKFFNATTPI